MNDGGVDDGAAADAQAVFFQVRIHPVEQFLAQVVALHEVAKLADRGFVRRRLPAQVDADERPQGARVVQGFLGRRVRQVEPVLQKIDAQHALNADGPATGAVGFGIERLDDFDQPRQGMRVSVSFTVK